MDPTVRFNQVQILDEKYPDKGARDDRGRPIRHTISVVRFGDGLTLAKYRDKEVILEKVTEKTIGDGEVVHYEEKEITGREAAARCCAINGWTIAKS